MLLILHIIVAHIKENVNTKLESYIAHPEGLGRAINHLCYL